MKRIASFLIQFHFSWNNHPSASSPAQEKQLVQPARLVDFRSTMQPREDYPKFSQLASRENIDKATGRSLASLGGMKAPALTTDRDSDDGTGTCLATEVSPRSIDNDHDLGSPLSPQERKRKRLAEQHNKSEQRRRRKINSKLDELQAMVPFSRSREKAAILLDVIEYIKSVQAQLHIMSAITACDYASYQPSSPPGDPYLSSQGAFSTPGRGMPATPIFPPVFPAAGAGMGSACPSLRPYSGAVPSLGGHDTSSGSGMDRGYKEYFKDAGWSLSSGESSPPMAAMVDPTESPYEPLMF